MSVTAEEKEEEEAEGIDGLGESVSPSVWKRSSLTVLSEGTVVDARGRWLRQMQLLKSMLRFAFTPLTCVRRVERHSQTLLLLLLLLLYQLCSRVARTLLGHRTNGWRGAFALVSSASV